MKNNALFENLRDIALKNLPKMVAKLPFDKIVNDLNNIQANKGINMQAALGFVQGLQDASKSKDPDAIFKFIGGKCDFAQAKNCITALNVPALNKAMGAVEGLLPTSSARTQFDSYLKLALEDGVITEAEEARLTQLGKDAGLSVAEISNIINSNK